LIAGCKKLPADPHSNASCAAQVEGNVRVLCDFIDTETGAGEEVPVERVAAFLSALSHNMEVRDPNLIGDSMACGNAANYLGLSVEKLGATRVELKRRRLIDLCPDKSLRILDVSARQDLAGQQDEHQRQELVMPSRKRMPQGDPKSVSADAALLFCPVDGRSAWRGCGGFRAIAASVNSN
jgi:hypothetical protein